MKSRILQTCLLIILSLFLGTASMAGTKVKTGAMRPAKASKMAPSATATSPVDINTADQQTLETLPGVGAATAKAIIAARPFKTVDDLQNVKGIGKAKFDVMKDKVTVSANAGAVAPVAAGKKPGTMAAQPAETVNINTADQKTLETLPGVGAATAKAIIAGRPFKTVDDLQKVKGIGKAKYDVLKDKVTIESAKTAPAPMEPSMSGNGQKAGSRMTQPGAAREPASMVEGAKTGTKMTQPGARETSKPAMPAGPININTADLKTLEALPGIGPVKAKAIIDNRPYNKIEDVMKVPGIKEGTFGKIKDQITVK